MLGRLSSEQRTLSGISKTLAYTYNLDGSLRTLTYPDNSVITYTPDSAGRMLSAVDTGNNINYITSATYGPDSGLTGFVSGQSTSFTGITNAFTYNNRLQPVNMSASKPGQTVFSIGYDFHLGAGDNGNVFGITNYKDSNRNQSFTYDTLNRLISAQNAGTDCSVHLPDGHTEYWGNSYGYDAWGNLLQKNVTKCSAENLQISVDTNNHIQTAGYSYDAAGNMLTDGLGHNFTYDSENRITGAAGYTYTYDADGNRVKKTNGSTGTLYWYMSPGIVAESDLSGTLKSEYVFFDGRRTARRDFSGGAVSYYFSDELKTTDIVTDAQGNIRNESDFYPWGGELQFLANDSNHYKFTGKERDGETGLDYFGARYYGNALGRFITPDWSAIPVPVPYADLIDPQSLNQYSYVRNIPTTNVDADGHGPLLGVTIDIIQYIAAHVGHVGTVEGNVRAQYNNQIQQTKASQGGTITSAQREAIKQEARQGSTSTGRALAEAHDAKTAAAKAAKAAAGTLEESAGRTNPGFNAAGKIGKVAGPLGTAVAVGIAVKNVADAPEGQKLETTAKEGGGIGGAIAGGEVGAGVGALTVEFTGPVGPVVGGIGGAIVGGIAGKGAVEKFFHPDATAPPQRCEGCGWVK